MQMYVSRVMEEVEIVKKLELTEGICLENCVNYKAANAYYLKQPQIGSVCNIAK
jgi:hypothetical protein